MDGDDAPRVPKYRAPDFMRKEIALFHQARNEARFLRRYGDDDDPIPPIARSPASGRSRPSAGAARSATDAGRFSSNESR